MSIPDNWPTDEDVERAVKAFDEVAVDAQIPYGRKRDAIKAALSAAPEPALATEGELEAALEDNENREARRIEILDFLQDEIGTAWTCDQCGYSTYHSTANECAECGKAFPILNLLAFKLHASHTDAPTSITPEASPSPAVQEGKIPTAFANFPIAIDPSLPDGVIELRDPTTGDLIGKIENAAAPKVSSPPDPSMREPN